MDNAAKITSEIKQYYNNKAGYGKYATSPDFNLREVEVDYLSRWIHDGLKVLDVGCGNGYSTIRFAEKYHSHFTGIDFVPEMVNSANALKNEFNVLGEVEFAIGDVTSLIYEDDSFDVVVSERCLLNLPSRELQWKALDEIARVTKRGGLYLMLEGTLQGLKKMNEVRGYFNLPPIPEADPTYNWFSNKFDEPKMLEKALDRFSKLETVERFGMYFFISRVIHPLLVYPEAPKYEAHINEIAQQICKKIPNFEDMGHEALFIFKK